MLAVIVGPHGRKVISSNARSFPNPPGALFVMRKTIFALSGGVVKKKPYCFHSGWKLVFISPVLNSFKRMPAGVSILKVILGIIPKRDNTFIIHAANSYVVLGHRS